MTSHVYVEVWQQGDSPELVPLEGERLAVGRGDENDLVLAGDPTVSWLHAVLERYGSGWCVRDLASSNGTFVNGKRLVSEHPLRPGDEIRLGENRLVFRSSSSKAPPPTVGVEGPPELTRRERDVLLALCRPLATGDLFAQPASIKDIAAALVVSDAAVKSHLVNLYDKFRLYDAGRSRRAQLAREAIRRRAVTMAELRQQ